MVAVFLVAAAYLCGSLPTGVWFGRWAGVDVRHVGSGNIGATNVARTAGLRPAVLTLISDVAKGLLPVLAARAVLTDLRPVAVVGAAAFFGHLFSVFLRFSGGKGVATGFGVFLGLAPLAAGLSALLFAAVALWTRYVSLASMLAAASLPLATLALGYAASVSWAAAIVAAAVLIRHRGNASRLRQGVEPKFRFRS